MRATLTRIFKDKKQTLGEIVCGDVTVCSLELPDLNNDGIEGNERQKSCIPEGLYRTTKENHKKFGWCYRVHGVPGRDGILIHAGTYYSHTLGCILPALDQKDLNADGLPDNVSSKAALAKLVECNFSSIEVISRP